MLGIPQLWFWLADVILFAVISVVALTADGAPWWMYCGFAGAFILLGLLVWANLRLWREQR
jgi:hypothetical protein